MMENNNNKNDLLQAFQEFLEQSGPDTPMPDNQPDLATLLNEMAVLTAEVKAGSRQFKNSLDTLDSALQGLREDNKSMSDQLAGQDQGMAQLSGSIRREMLLEFVELYDLLAASLRVLKGYRPRIRRFRKSSQREVDFINQVGDGQQMILERFDSILQDHEVQPIECLGKKFDPNTMKAVATGYEPHYENGVVIEEIRTGFLFQEKVLRLAEVKVNRVERS